MFDSLLTLILSDIIPKGLQSLGSEIGDAWPVFVALAAFLLIIVWGFKKIVMPEIRKELGLVSDIKYQVTNNGGNSMKDAVDRVEKMFGETIHKMDEMRLERSLENKEVKEGLTELAALVNLHSSRLSVSVESDDRAWYQIDENANIISVNFSYLHMFGISYQEAMNNEWTKYTYPEDAEALNASGLEAMKTHLPWTHTFRIKNKNGVSYKVVGRAYPTFNSDKFTGYVGAMHFTPLETSLP